MILPILLLSLLNCLVFLLPVESGEKMTVSVTIFLSFAVFLSLIDSSLPPNSDSVCLFSVYLAVQMFLGVCSIVMAACTVFIFGQNMDWTSAPQRQLQSADFPKGKMTPECSNSYPENSSQIVLDAVMNNSSDSAVYFENNESSQSSLESASSISGTGKEDGEGFLNVQDCSGDMSFRRIWLKLTRFHHLGGHERRLLSRQLDKMCFKLTFCINIIVCFTFCGIWIFT
ncbi:hypothetical protein ACOMHN_027152 [Nucella lapillus]